MKAHYRSGLSIQGTYRKMSIELINKVVCGDFLAMIGYQAPLKVEESWFFEQTNVINVPKGTL